MLSVIIASTTAKIRKVGFSCKNKKASGALRNDKILEITPMFDDTKWKECNDLNENLFLLLIPNKGNYQHHKGAKKQNVVVFLEWKRQFLGAFFS